MREMRFGIRSKIMIGYVFIIICVTASFILVNDQLVSMKKDRNYVIEHDFEVNNETNILEKYVMDMESEERGYLLTGEVIYINSFSKGEAHWRDSFNHLNDLTSGNPVQG